MTHLHSVLGWNTMGEGSYWEPEWLMVFYCLHGKRMGLAF
jgi:hypothetical protein